MKKAHTLVLASLVAGLASTVSAVAGSWLNPLVDCMQPVDLPELMRAADGSQVRTVAEWESRRRPELLEFFTRNMHGVRPVERPADLAFSPIAPDADMLGGTVVRKQVRATFSGPYGGWGFNILAFLPKSDRPVPAFILICNRALEKKA